MRHPAFDAIATHGRLFQSLRILVSVRLMPDDSTGMAEIKL
ncbi:hypothetical protein ACZ87_01029 [Candidatus Erwinia dacicola]|uniref:Uncharacterized protein n=1 Tax=Candidatus Erwinia dacicola TaxID=252393 RepID=A0A328TNC0_9GAMM|nr:hypothetical protein ACZ87_01029 [Candidatus Erwinia dacicola]